MSNLEQIVTTMQSDFEQGNAPFDDVEFPEKRLLREMCLRSNSEPADPMSMSMEKRLRLISMFATFDYNRNASQLVDNILALHDHNPSFFDPYYVSSNAQVEDALDPIGFRYPFRDAKGWVENCRIIRENYHGKWHELVLDTGCDAKALVERLKIDEFLYLKGDKIAPMYARIINDDVAPLRNVWDLEIPVDTWVRKISKEIFQEDISDDEIRQRWREISAEADINRAVVDGALWQIGNNLNTWGGPYLKEVLNIERFKYL